MKPAPATEPGAAADYAGRVARHVPGFHDLHRMTALLLAERVPDTGQVLVLGAGSALGIWRRPGPATAQEGS